MVFGCDNGGVDFGSGGGNMFICRCAVIECYGDNAHYHNTIHRGN